MVALVLPFQAMRGEPRRSGIVVLGLLKTSCPNLPHAHEDVLRVELRDRVGAPIPSPRGDVSTSDPPRLEV